MSGSHLPKAMSLPVRPPTLLRTPFTLCAAPLKAGPAEEVTLERPSEAFEFMFEAASEVVEACRKGFDRATKRECRSIRRNVGVDMKRVTNRGDAVVRENWQKK